MTPTTRRSGPLAVIVITMTVLASAAQSQGFTSTLIPSPAAFFNPSISLAVNTINGTSYCGYTSGGGQEVIYGTKLSGGSWVEEDLLMSASEVSLTTTLFTQGNVTQHLALLGAYKPGPPVMQGCVMYATRSTGGVWTYEVVDNRTRTTYSASITLNISKVPRIAYVLQGNDLDPYDRLELATRIGPNNWQIETVDSVFGGFDDVTLRMAGGLIYDAITYGRLEAGAPTFRFLYAQRTGSWAFEDIEPTTSNPQNGAMTMTPTGVAQVAYWTNDGLLNYAYRAGANNWVRTKLRPALSYNIDRSISIIHDPGNNPHIAYYSQGGDSIRYASKSRFGWNYQRVEQLVGNGGPLSIGIHSASPQRPKIAYRSVDSLTGDRYYFAEGTETIHGNFRATQPSEESQAPSGTELAVSNGRVMSGASIALSISQVEGASVELLLVDVAGRTIARRAPEWLPAGRHEISWDVGSPSSGVYFVRMKTGHGVTTARKVVFEH